MPHHFKKFCLSPFLLLFLGAIPTMGEMLLCRVPTLAQTVHDSVSDREALAAEAEDLANRLPLLQETQQYQAMIEKGQQALSLYAEIRNFPSEDWVLLSERQSEANILQSLGIAYLKLGQYPKALEVLQRSLNISQELGDRDEQSRTLSDIASVYLTMNQFQKALEVYQQAFLMTEDSGAQAVSLNGMGNVYNALEQYRDAINCQQQSITLSGNSFDKTLWVNSLEGLIHAYERLGLAQEVIQTRQQLAVVRAAEADSKLELGRRYVLGLLHISSVDHEMIQSIFQILEQAMDMYRQTNNLLGEAAVFNTFAKAYWSTGQYQQAIDYYQKSLALAQQLNNSEQARTAVEGLGEVYSSLGQYQQAIKFYQRTLSLSSKPDLIWFQYQSLNNLGNAYRLLRQYPEAIDAYKQALRIIQELQERTAIFSTLVNLGSVYHDSNQDEEAKIYFQEAIPLAVPGAGNQVPPDALADYGQGLWLLGHYQAAIDFYQTNLSVQQLRGPLDQLRQGIILTNLGNSFLLVGNPAAAEVYLEDAVQVWESIRANLGSNDAYKISIFETQLSTYRYWQCALIAQGKTEQALETSERGRARAFVEQLAQRLGSQSVEELVAQNIPTLEQIKQIAQTQNTTLVEYSIVSDKELYIWVVKPTGEITFQQVDLSTLNASLADFVDTTRQAIGVTRSFVAVRPRLGTEQQQTQWLKQLYQLLIQPIADQLPTDPNAPVIFVPQGELFSVPFAALKDASGNDLIDKHTILTSPSIQILDKTRQLSTQVQQANLHDVLVVGNPTMPRVSLAGESPRQLDPLEGAKREAETIAPLLQAQPLIGSQAKKATVVQRMQQARMIHLATHGLLDNRQGLDSAIALAPDGTGEINDGLLTAAEIAQMQLNAELVVLSACDTGQGRITGDGVIGLSRALITAGVPSVLVSLWSVPDAPTAELMSEFYRQLQQTGNKAQALRQAMLITKAKHPNPRDWAAFTLIGEAQ